MATPADDLAIRLARDAFNRALVHRDIAAIRPLLAPDAILIAGTDSAVLYGRKAQLLAWTREFAAADPTTYVRTPGTITLSPVAPIALEEGRWTGMGGDGQPQAAGTYVAKWRRTHAHWVIEAEIYLTLA